MVAEIIDLESAILTVTAGYSPDPRWAGRSSAKTFTEKLRILIQQVLAEPEWQSRLTTVDLRALSPLKWQHVNPYGTFNPSDFVYVTGSGM
jgi:hypothetical protein